MKPLSCSQAHLVEVPYLLKGGRQRPIHCMGPATKFMNLDVKKMHPDSPLRIDKVITMLGGPETADAHIREADRQGRGKPDDYTSV